MDPIVTTGFRCLILFSPLEESRLKIIATNALEYILEDVVRLQIYGRTLSLESSFYHIFIQVQKSEWEPYIDPRVITPPHNIMGSHTGMVIPVRAL